MPAFPKEQSKIPTKIGQVSLEVTLFTDATELSDAIVRFQVLGAANEVISRQTHDALNHLSATQKTAIYNLLNAIRTKANSEVIGP